MPGTWEDAYPGARDAAALSQESTRPAERGSRLFIVVLSILTLSAILWFVDERVPRLIFGALAVGFLTWSACTIFTGEPRKALDPPPGIRERRNGHTPRRRVGANVSNVRRLDGIARDMSEDHVSRETETSAFDEVNKALYERIRQIRALAGRDL